MGYCRICNDRYPDVDLHIARRYGIPYIDENGLCPDCRDSYYECASCKGFFHVSMMFFPPEGPAVCDICESSIEAMMEEEEELKTKKEVS